MCYFNLRLVKILDKCLLFHEVVMDDMDQEDTILFLIAQVLHLQRLYLLTMGSVIHYIMKYHYNRRLLSNRTFVTHATILDYIKRIITNNDVECISQLRMDRRTFAVLCELLRNTGRLKTDSLVFVEEQVCISVHILAHHVKNRTIRNRFYRSGETISRYFNSVLSAVLQLHNSLLVSPNLVPENCTDERWKKFKVSTTYN